MDKKYYITTPIYYPSGSLHIGHCYCTVAADSIARYKRLRGYDVKFLTGTDEHGQKIEEKAKAAGVTPIEYVDNIVTGIKQLWKYLKITNDDFLRTTEERHEKIVQKIFTKLYEQGDIYKGEYEGKYCTPCESFWTETQLVDGKCPDCGREVKLVKEESYFFKLSKYQDKLEDLFTNNTYFVQPDARRKEMLNNFIKPGVQDLCVSRTSFKWGIPVDFDEGHVVYVWLDALSNYITFLGYDVDEQSDKFKKYWPCDLHLIGKDIIRFHTIYWPCFLWSLGVELPKQVFGHPWLLTGDDKMSKSKGNVIYADDLVDLFGVDAVRFYLLNAIPFANDGTITYDLVIDRVNSELANTLGNLVQRTISMGNKYFDGKVSNKKVSEDVDTDFINLINGLDKKVENCMEDYHISDALAEIFTVLRASNKYIDDTTPWILAKDEAKQDRLETVLYNLLESIRVCGSLLLPFLPDTSCEIHKQINNKKTDLSYLEDNSYELGQPSPLFQRIDKDKLDL